MRLIGQVAIFLVTLAAGFGLGILASGWVTTDWSDTDDNDTATGI